MKHSPWEASRFSASQIHCFEWNLKVHLRIHKRPTLVPMLTQINPVHAPLPLPGPSSFLMVGFNIIVPSALRSSSGLFRSRFPIKTLYEPHYSTLYMPRPFHLFILDLITRIIFGDECKSYSASLRSLHHPPVTSPLLRPDIFSSPYSRILCLCSSRGLRGRVMNFPAIIKLD